MAKATAGPKVLTANRLRDGAVVYLSSEGGWVESVEGAAIVQAPDQLVGLQDRAQTALRANEVVDVVAIEVTAAQHPVSLRERIRLVGPTVRPDLARS